MNSQQIEKLLEKYFYGDTSLEEEKHLRDFFAKDIIPKHLLSLKPQFEYFSKEKKKNFLDDFFDEKILETIEKEKIISIKRKRRNYIYIISGVAASILVIVSLFIQFNSVTNKFQNTFNDPQLAYAETQKALLFVSEKLNIGIQPVSKAAARFDEGVGELSRISTINTSVKELNRLSKFYKYQQIITNPFAGMTDK